MNENGGAYHISHAEVFWPVCVSMSKKMPSVTVRDVESFLENFSKKLKLSKEFDIDEFAKVLGREGCLYEHACRAGLETFLGLVEEAHNSHSATVIVEGFKPFHRNGNNHAVTKPE